MTDTHVLGLHAAQMRDHDRQLVERCLPAHMMVLMMEECQKIGLEMRPDVLHRLNVASIAPLAKSDAFTVARLAMRVDDAARTLLNDLSPDDPRHGLYSCAMFAITLVDEGRIADVKNMAVLVALMLMDDLKDDAPDEQGQGVVWRLQEQKLKQEAKKLLGRCALMGLFAQLELRLPG
jgi:hypothetical protein